MKPYKEYVKSAMGERLKEQGFNVYRGRFWYKLENGLLYRFGSFREELVAEVLPTFCRINHIRLTDFNRSLRKQLFKFEVVVNPYYLLFDHGDDPGVEKRIEEDIVRQYETYVQPYFGAITSIRESYDYLTTPLEYEYKDSFCFWLSTVLPPKYSIVGDYKDVLAHMIYLKEYDALEKYILSNMIFMYDRQLDRLRGIDNAFYLTESSWKLSETMQEIVDKSKEGMKLGKMEELGYYSMLQTIKSSTEGWVEEIKQIVNKYRPGGERNKSELVYYNLLNMIEEGDEKGLMMIIEENRKVSEKEISKIWPKSKELPSWLTTPLV